MDEDENWLGFVQAISKLFHQSDKISKSRFNKMSESLAEHSSKTNRIIKNMKGDITSIKTEMHEMKKMMRQIVSNQAKIMQDKK